MGLHFMTIRNYMLFYTINSEIETVSILRIMYGGRDVSRVYEKISVN